MSRTDSPQPRTRAWIARGFTAVEDVVYIGLGLLLTGCALVLLASGFLRFGQGVLDGSLPTRIVALLDRILLILLVVELLYTVQVSFREHALLPEPFLLVGLIAAIRRVLVLTAEFGEVSARSEAVLRYFVIELGVLTLLILTLVASLRMLRRKSGEIRAERA